MEDQTPAPQNTADLIRLLLDTLPEEAREQASQLLEEAPNLKPSKALGPTDRVRFDAAAARALTSLDIEDPEAVIGVELLAIVVESCDTALRIVAADAKSYHKWTTTIPDELLHHVLLARTLEAVELVKK